MIHRKSAGLVPVALLAVVLLAGCGVNQLPDPAFTALGVDLRLAMRDLWQTHTTWTQLYVADTYSGMTDAADPASNRLMRNADDIANRFKTYFGEDSGNQLAGLLRDHVSAMTTFVAAAPLGDSTQQAAALDQWNANTDSIAEFLAGLNHNWSKETLGDLLGELVNLTSDDVLARMNKQYEADVKDGDAMQLQGERVADELSRGIIKQFPTNFQTVKPH